MESSTDVNCVITYLTSVNLVLFKKGITILFKNTSKPVSNDHAWDPKILAFVDTW